MDFNTNDSISNYTFRHKLRNGTNTTDDFVVECGYALNFFDILRLWQCFIGLALNLVQICVVASNKKLRENTYIAISCLAIADLAYLFLMLISLFIVFPVADKETFMIYDECDSILNIGKITIWFRVLDVLTSSSYTSSSLHMILLSSVRYAVLVHPFFSKAHLSNNVVMLSSALIWIIGISLNLLNLFAHENQKIMQISIWFVNYPFVVFFIVVVHLMKIKGLKRLRMSRNRSPQTQMNLFVAATLIVFIIFPMPWNIINFLHVFSAATFSQEIWHYTGVVLVINNCINPIIFGFTSPACRNGLSSLLHHMPCFKPLFKKRRHANTEASQMTHFSKVSRRSSSIAAVGDSCILTDANHSGKELTPLSSEL